MINKNIFLLIIPFVIYGQTYDINNKSKITYYGYHYTKNWDGYSHNINGVINYNFTDNTVNSCSLRVNLSTFDSGNSNRDSNMLTYLEAFNYPDVVFVSSDIFIKGENAFINGKLSLHGVIKEIDTMAKLSLADGFIASGTFNILLSDFGIERPALLFKKINDEIKIEYMIIGKQ